MERNARICLKEHSEDLMNKIVKNILKASFHLPMWTLDMSTNVKWANYSPLQINPQNKKDFGVFQAVIEV